MNNVSSPAIRITHLSKTYYIPSLNPWKIFRKQDKEKTEALVDISLHCPHNQITCLLGPNGAGKTTLVKILAGLIWPDTGEVTMLGESIYKSSLRIRRKVGLVSPNERSFYWRLSGRQNLDFFAALQDLKNKEKKHRIREVADELKMNDYLDKPFRLYSTGMKQKLVLARALLGYPELLLLDEPTAHLDPNARKEMHQLIKETLIKQKKTTILLSTHDLNEAQELANHLVLLNKGKVVVEGNLAGLRQQLYKNKILNIEYAQKPQPGWHTDYTFTDLKQHETNLEIEGLPEERVPDIIRAFILHGGRITSCFFKDKSLEDIFTHLTKTGQ